MITMYDRSRVVLYQSKDALSHLADDDAFLDAACFDAQQAIEFLMKFILSEYGVEYDRSHDIAYLLALLDETGFTFDKHDTLELLAGTITSWEEQSRYGKGIRTTTQTIQRVHNIYKSIDDSFLSLQKKNNEDLKEL